MATRQEWQCHFYKSERVVLELTWPVSYTHLRAHETVLDLVCRLLLEKKNNKYTNSYLQIHTELYDIVSHTSLLLTSHNYIVP